MPRLAGESWTDYKARTAAFQAACPPGYVRQANGGCLIGTAMHRELQGIAPDATTTEANAILAVAGPLPTTPYVVAPQVAAEETPQETTPTKTLLAEGPTMNTDLLNAAGAPANVNWLGALTGAVGGFIAGGPGGALVGGLTGALGPGGESTGGSGSSISDVGSSMGFAPSTPSCPSGYVLDSDGRCKQAGIGGTVARILPGGSSGYLPTDSYGPAVMGRYGAALTPAQVQGYRLKCPPGAVLGKDDLCYDKLTNKERKWPYHKPYITAGDFHAITRANSARKRLITLTKRSGAYAAMKRPQITKKATRRK